MRAVRDEQLVDEEFANELLAAEAQITKQDGYDEQGAPKIRKCHRYQEEIEKRRIAGRTLSEVVQDRLSS
jgi:hypothetical protein